MPKLGVTAVDYEKLSDSKKKELTIQLLKSREAMKQGITSSPPPKTQKPQTREAMKQGITSSPPPKTQKPQTRKAHRIRSDESVSPRSSRGGFSYFNADIHQNGGRKTVRKVSIKNGKGHKIMTQYKKGKKMFTVKKPLTIVEIVTIQRGQFIPGLFSDCKGEDCNKK